MIRKKIPGHLYADKEKRPTVGHLLLAVIGSFAGIAAVAYIGLSYRVTLMLPSLGASAVLLYAASHVPMAKIRNVVGGHVVSAVAGVAVYRICGLTWWTVALGVSLAITGMVLTDTLHPPGGATAFAAVAGRQDYYFVLTPVLAGVLLLVLVALLIHYLKNRQPRGQAGPDKESPI